MMEQEDLCCVDGHVEDCPWAEPAYDFGDLVSRPFCAGCCPHHRPKGLRAEAAEALTKFNRILGRGPR